MLVIILLAQVKIENRLLLRRICVFSEHQSSRTMGEASYSFSLTTFSPSGKLMQIEYALNAVAKGKTSLGIRAADGVVLATEKKMPSHLIEQEFFAKIQRVAPHIGVVYSGMGPDFRVLVKSARTLVAYKKHIRR